MKICTIWTPTEGYNVLQSLRRLYGGKRPEILLKRAVREFVEMKRIEHYEGKLLFNMRRDKFRYIPPV